MADGLWGLKIRINLNKSCINHNIFIKFCTILYKHGNSVAKGKFCGLAWNCTACRKLWALVIDTSTGRSIQSLTKASIIADYTEYHSTSRKTLCNSVHFICQLVMAVIVSCCIAVNVQLSITCGSKKKSRYSTFALLNTRLNSLQASQTSSSRIFYNRLNSWKANKYALISTRKYKLTSSNYPSSASPRYASYYPSSGRSFVIAR